MKRRSRKELKARIARLENQLSMTRGSRNGAWHTLKTLQIAYDKLLRRVDRYFTPAVKATEPSTDPTKYVIHDRLMELVFRRNAITDMSDLQRILDLVEEQLPEVLVPPYGWRDLTPSDDVRYKGYPVRVIGAGSDGLYDMVFRDSGDSVISSEIYSLQEGPMISWRNPHLTYHGPWGEETKAPEPERDESDAAKPPAPFDTPLYVWQAHGQWWYSDDERKTHGPFDTQPQADIRMKLHHHNKAHGFVFANVIDWDGMINPPLDLSGVIVTHVDHLRGLLKGASVDGTDTDRG